MIIYLAGSTQSRADELDVPSASWFLHCINTDWLIVTDSRKLKPIAMEQNTNYFYCI